MNLKLKHFSLARRLEILIQTNTDLKAQLLELLELREQLRTATRDRSLVQTKNPPGAGRRAVTWSVAAGCGIRDLVKVGQMG